MEYDIRITVTGDEDMVEINIRQGDHGELLCYGGSSIKDVPDNVAGALEEFIVEVEDRSSPIGRRPNG